LRKKAPLPPVATSPKTPAQHTAWDKPDAQRKSPASQRKGVNFEGDATASDSPRLSSALVSTTQAAMLRPTLLATIVATFTTTTYADLKREPFAKTADGQTVERITLTNKNGLVARIITWGATLTELHAPDRDGRMADITIGFDKPEQWLKPHPFFGCTAGRFANRIARGKFSIDGTEYSVTVNNGENHLHGGKVGFDKRVWIVEAVGLDAVRLSYTSPDGEEGFPGTLKAVVTYTLNDANELRLDYEATTDKPTVVNLTNHTYWNLGNSADILGHELQMPAAKYVEVDAGSIPTGVLAAAEGAMDFQKAKVIGRDIAALAGAPGGGFDHNWVIDGWTAGKMHTAAELHDPSSGRVLRITTTEPGIQFYSGNYVKDVAGKGGRVYGKYAGLCLETQHFPDAPNQPSFASTILRPGETFRSTTVHHFSAK
jgi:aldose 1-epimerase